MNAFGHREYDPWAWKERKTHKSAFEAAFAKLSFLTYLQGSLTSYCWLVVHRGSCRHVAKSDTRVSIRKMNSCMCVWYLRPSKITVYTDGSKTWNGVGAGFVIYHKAQRIYTHSLKLSKHTTVFQAEIYAIYEAAKHLIQETNIRFKYVKIYCRTRKQL